MHGIAYKFIATAAVAALIGMAWGIQMAATGDHTLSPAHGHLNLIGFVTMGLFGIYYHLVPDAAETRLARVHFWLTLAAVIILVPGIALAITGTTEAVAPIGSILAIASMAIFAFVVVLRHGHKALGHARA